MDYAVEQGVNFFDAAEMYPIPVQEETFGRTEEIIGSWLKRRGKRDDIVIATKVAGPAARFPYLRGGTSTLDAKNIAEAVDTSLKRMGIEYIDLYQTHWPARNTNFFSKLGYTHDPDETLVPVEETLAALETQVKAGKIRHVGVSNESAWGVMRHLAAAEAGGGPRIVSIQNPYSLLNRTFEVGLAEPAIRENVGLLAYSPLAFGALSGKYLDGAKPEGARLTLWGDVFGRYTKPLGVKATQAYVDIAAKHGLDPSQMALAYCNGREFLTSTIIGATTMEQLKTNIASIDLDLSDAAMADIESVHVETPNPAP